MLRFLLLLVFVLVAAIPSFSQSKQCVVGYISDTTGKKPVEYAAVALLSIRDSSIVSSAVTDINGVFEIRNILPGRYLVKVSHMSYKPSLKRINTRSVDEVFNVGNIRMDRKQIALDELVVVGKSTPVRISKDTIEFNAGSYRPKEQDVVADVLRKLPGVSVDKDGAVTINGKPVTQIMIDGKKFFLNDPSLATQNLPADIVDKIQVVDKKSDQAEFTKVDDGNTEKIINLTLKPEKKRGLFGSYRVGGGTNDSYDIGARLGGFENSTQAVALGGYNNINRQGGGNGVGFPSANRQGIVTVGNTAVNLNYEPSTKLHTNGSYRFGYSNNDREISSNRQNIDTRGIFNSDRLSKTSSVNWSNSLYSRIEYKMDTTFSAIVTPNFQFSNGNLKDEGISLLFDENSELVNSEERKSSKNSESANYGMGVLLQKQLKQPRQTLSAFVNTKAGDSQSDVITLQKNYYTIKDSTNIRNQSIVVRGNNSILSANLAYTHPLWSFLTAELLYEFEYGATKSTNEAFDLNPSTQKYDIENELYSKKYRNAEYKNTTGLSLNYSHGALVAKVGANLGMVSQDYSNKIGTMWLDTTLAFRNISPSMMLSFNPSESFDLSFSYSGNTRQPGVEQLHPVQNPNTPNSILLGNPLLKPEFNHRLSLSYGYFNKENFFSLNSSIGVSITNNAITGQSDYDKLGKYYYRAVNVDGLYRFGCFTSLGKSMLSNKLHVSASVDVDYSHTPGFANMEKYFANQLTMGESLKTYLTLDFLEVGANCGYSLSLASYDGLNKSFSSLKTNQRYSTLSVEGSITARFPANIEISSTFDAMRKFGDMYGAKDGSYLWNGAITKMFFKDKSLSLSFMAFDILNKFKPYSRNVTSTYIEEVQYKAMTQLYMVTVSYNLNRFGAKKGVN